MVAFFLVVFFRWLSVTILKVHIKNKQQTTIIERTLQKTNACNIGTLKAKKQAKKDVHGLKKDVDIYVCACGMA